MKIQTMGEELSMRKDRQDEYNIQFSQLSESA